VRCLRSLRSRKARGVLFAAACIVLGSSAWARAAELSLRQLNHRVYTAMEAAPSQIDALAQTSDGTLWIGSRGGLTRFDGARFVPYPGPSEQPLRATNIAALLATPDGGLWIGFRPGGVSFVKNGRVTHYGEADGIPASTVQQLAYDHDGLLWAAARSGVAYFDGKRWATVTGDPRLDRVYGALVDRTDSLWFATAKGLLTRTGDEPEFREIDQRDYSDSRGTPLALAPDGSVWAIAKSELVQVTPPPGSPASGWSAPSVLAGPLLFDEAGNLWAADVGAAI
jgi:ligand-binding sensor domain-containing protein